MFLPPLFLSAAPEDSPRSARNDTMLRRDSSCRFRD
jgi:hypothetical protein